MTPALRPHLAFYFTWPEPGPREDSHRVVSASRRTTHDHSRPRENPSRGLFFFCARAAGLAKERTMERIEDRNLAAHRAAGLAARGEARVAADRRRRRRRARQRARAHPRRAARPRPHAGWSSIVGPVLDPRSRRGARVRDAARSAVADATRDALVVVMRTYFEKPRTTVGWKGLINDPHLDGSCDIAGRPRARRARSCSRSTRSACRARASCSIRSCRSTSPTCSAGRRSARAPPRARRTARWRAACRCRSASRTAPTAACTSRSTR